MKTLWNGFRPRSRRAERPLCLSAGPAGWSAEWTARRNGTGSAPARLEFAGTPPEARLEDAAGFGRQLAEQLRAAGFRGAEAELVLPLDWTVALRAERPNGLADGDVPGFLDLQAERAAPFGGAGWRLAAPPADADPAARALVAAVLPEPRWLALEAVASAAGLRWVSARTDLPAQRPGDAPAVLEVRADGGRCTAVARRDGRALDWAALPAGDAAERAALPAELGLFLRSLSDGSSVPPAFRWEGTPDPALRGVVEGWARGAGLAVASDAAPAAGASFEFIRAAVRPEPAWLRAARRHVPRRGRWALAAAAALLLLVPGVRWAIAGVLRVRAARLAPALAESGELQRRLRLYRPWLDPDRAGAGALETLAGVFPEDGRVWARRVELRDGRRVACVGAARGTADAVALMERLRRAPGVREVQVQYLRGGEPAQFAFDFEWRAGP